jgi:brefeldin A-inhibited guanine nucleotide-exchange protein
MTFFFKSKCIENDTPKDVAKFLLNTEGLSKKNIGEFLGEGEQYNINIMHAFVELMDFSGLKFVDALRLFLQSFRLPGEAQKIDRFMLTFAQQFVLYNPAVFANADTAYVLAYSVIMLNTDLHNPQIKKRMSKPDFVKNNRGINDNANLPQEFLEEIYEEILNNEIKMKEEQLAELKDNTKEFTSVRRKREAMMQVTEDLASKVEGLFRELETKRARLFFRGHQPEHVRPMILSCWLYFLSGLSGPLQESDEPETLHVCLDGVKSAIRITCHFDMDLERNAFISAISKFTMLSNVNDLSLKNIEAVKVLLDVAWMEGNHLQKSWMDVIRCISLLEKFQIVSNSDAAMSMMQPNQSSDAVVAKKQLGKRLALEESLSQSMVIAIDKIFSSSHKLSGVSGTI